MERQIITVDIAPGNSQVQRLTSSQGDIGRPMGVRIIQNGVDLDCSAYTAIIYILKTDGNYYTANVSVDSTDTSLIYWDTEEQETPCAGNCAAQIRIMSGDDDIGTARFVEYVEASPGFCGTGSESVVESLKEYVRSAKESSETAVDAAETATGAALSAADSASAAGNAADAAESAASNASQDASSAAQSATDAQHVLDSIPADYTALSDDVSDLKSANLLEEEYIPGTTQTITFDSSGNVQSITHTANNVAVRTDTFTFGTDTITEVRALSTGESLTIVTNTDTLVTTTTYADAA